LTRRVLRLSRKLTLTQVLEPTSGPDADQTSAGSFTSVSRMLFPEGSRKPESIP
jgi:hypothetical protein